MSALQDEFLQKVNAGENNAAADILNGMSMPDMLAALTALGSNGPLVANNLSGILSMRGWAESAARIRWAGEVIRTKTIPYPLTGLPTDQLNVVRKFLRLKPAPNPDGRYTSNPNEIAIVQTVVTARVVIAALKTEWPTLSETGIKLLAAQFMYETGGGRSCFNWNLGGVKGKEAEPHFYMTTFECWPAAIADSELKGNGRSPTTDEAHSWRCKVGKIVVYDPPNPYTRFKNFPSLAVSARDWVGLHKLIANKFPEFVPALESGDIPGVVAVLKKWGPAGYFTGDAEDYKFGMTTHLKNIEATAR